MGVAKGGYRHICDAHDMISNQAVEALGMVDHFPEVPVSMVVGYVNDLHGRLTKMREASGTAKTMGQSMENALVRKNEQLAKLGDQLDKKTSESQARLEALDDLKQRVSDLEEQVRRAGW